MNYDVLRDTGEAVPISALTEIFEDGSLAISYDVPDSTLDIAAEAKRNGIADPIYWLDTASGERIFIHPSACNGRGLIGIDPNPERRDNEKRILVYYLDGPPPRTVTISETCRTPDREITGSPVTRLVMSEYPGATVEDHERLTSDNPFSEIIERFDRAAQRAAVVSALAQARAFSV